MCNLAKAKATTASIHVIGRLESESILAAMPKLVKPKYKHVHACPQCDYKTGKVSDLRKHVHVVHEQRRDHACPQCAAAFGQASKLTRQCARCTDAVRASSLVTWRLGYGLTHS